jgi:hypothetical protein
MQEACTFAGEDFLKALSARIAQAGRLQRTLGPRADFAI